LSQLVFATINTSGSPVATASVYSINDARVSGYNTGSLGFGTVGGSGVISERMRLDASGNLGIGTTSPVAKLSVDHAIALTGSGAAKPASLGYGMYLLNGLGTVLYSAASTAFYAGDAERARIDSSGRVLVGTDITDKGVLTVYNNAASFSSVQAFAYFKGTQASDSGTVGLYIAKFSNDSSTSQLLVRFGHNNGGNGLGQINGNGANAAAFGTFSDVRLKENIEDLPPQLANITALRPVEFDYKDGSGHQIGFIAQEMQEVYSDAIAENSDGMLTVTGWDKTTARLVKAIQEQQAIITQLQADVASLKGTV
jgi:hypothetical protein